ncbi:signal transduction histidine kinase/DNA-binding response OmpR family regulator [Bosea sp. BE125]|uniref:ATP-binding protein n=1 Tax=Bosea sp. BE125 TaxID=2817909 RepID=UPI002856B4E3|nr:ATP-binding protein [Bosea sp. BE125]MDR6870352.1 signal transduction histidine kinase/DNA-binding response OmpR family regulator [Bosea sp. BE125]
MQTRKTRLFDYGVMALVGVSILLGCVVVATFSAIGARQRATEESVREDAVWAAYQLDSEVKKLIGAVHDLETVFIAPRRADVTLRYDILYSRASVLTNGHYAVKFGGETELITLAQEARQRILALAPLIDALDLAGEPVLQVSPLLLELETMAHLSERLLNVSNLAHSRIRVQDRAELRSVYAQLASAMAALIVSLAAIVIYLGIQLRHIRIARRRSELLSIENAEAAKRAEAGARAKSIFLATMSHEIRTPLNGIIGMVDIMRDSAMSAGQRDRLAVIGDCSDTLLALIDDILDFSKLESGAVEFELAPFELGEVCAAVSNVMGQRACEKGIVLHVDNPQALVTTDATRLRQILFNLVGNAVKFTDSGWVRLACSLDQRDCLRVEVEDTGIGIPAEARDRLFQDFSQLDITINRRFGGTGLGLAICRRLIGALGGEIGVSPREGGGSRFWFTLPVSPVAASQAATASVPAQDSAQEPARDLTFSGRILVAEDNLINFIVVSELLQRLGLQVDHAPNGEIAVHLAGATHYDLVLMDMQMPVMDGLEATRTIRRRGLATLPIIALTANAFSSDREDCLAAGMSDFVAKPINRAKMTAILAKWLPEYASAIESASDAAKADALDDDVGPGLIDHAARDELRREIGGDLMDELTRDFWPDATRMVSAAGKAFASGEIGLAIRELHTLKGVAGTLGLAAVAAAAEVAEHAFKASGAADMAVLQATLLRTILTMDANEASRETAAIAASA